MKKVAYIITGALLSLLLSGCEKQPAAETADAPAKRVITFGIRLNDGTKVSPSPTSAQEGAINKLAVLVFNGNFIEDRIETTTDTSVDFELEPGEYTVVAVANYGTNSPMSATTLSGVRATNSLLDDNSVGNFVMYGEKSVTVTRTSGGTEYIQLKRLVAKLGIKKISVEFTSPVVATRTFTLRKIYVTNAFRQNSLYAASTPVATTSLWYNMKAYSSSAKNDLLAETEINTVIAQGASNTTEHYFYCYENSITSANDVQGGTWSPRCSRMVIEATVGSDTFYWTITVPNIVRNKTYFAQEVIIRKLGSTNPDVYIPGAADVSFEPDNDDWEFEYDVDETF